MAPTSITVNDTIPIVDMLTPDHIKEIDHKNKQAMINAYDNSIVATDKFLAQVIDKLDRTGKTSAMLYLSDHGGRSAQDDERNRFLHASPHSHLLPASHTLCHLVLG